MAPGRIVTVEPLAALVAVAALPLMQLNQQYIVQRFVDQLSAEHGVNDSSSFPESESQCPQSNRTHVNSTYDVMEEAQASASVFLIYLQAATAVPATVITPFIASYGDQKGRKYAVVPPVLGIFLKTLVLLLVVGLDLPLWVMILGSFIEGLSGDYHGFTAASVAYITDITTSVNRTFRMTVLQSSTMLPLIISPLIIGYVVNVWGYFYPFFGIFLLQAIGLLYAVFWVQETLVTAPTTAETKFWKLSVLKEMLGVFQCERKPEGSKGRLRVLLVVVCLGTWAIVGNLTITTLFQLNSPLCWNSLYVGIFLAVRMAVGGLGQVCVLWTLKHCLSDISICLISSCLSVLQNIYFGFVQNTAMMFSAVIFATVAWLTLTLGKSIMSRMVEPHEQGKIFGAIACVDRILTVAATFFNLIYAKTLYISSGFVFFVIAGLCAVNSILVLILVVSTPRQPGYVPIPGGVESCDSQDRRTQGSTDC